MAYTRLGGLLALSVLGMTVIDSAQAQAAAATDTKRVALVIGNSAYQNVNKLTNPRNDATDIAAKLKSLQFEVVLATDADRAAMAAALDQFQRKVTKDHVALVFYAGHGVTVNRESFLLPVDMPEVIELDEKGEPRPEAVNRQLVSMASVLAPLESSKIGIVFLDACRNDAADPGLNVSARSVSKGQVRSLPVMRGTGSLEIKPSAHSAGVFRAYATQLNNVASDGAGRNSPFTKALLEHIGKKGITIQQMMIEVRKSVMKETGNEQIPWEEAALNELFYFVVPDPAAARVTTTTTGRSTTADKPAAQRRTNTLPPNLGVGVGGGL